MLDRRRYPRAPRSATTALAQRRNHHARKDVISTQQQLREADQQV